MTPVLLSLLHAGIGTKLQGPPKRREALLTVENQLLAVGQIDLRASR